MQTRQYFIQAILQTASDRGTTKNQPFSENLQQTFYRRFMIKSDHIHIHAITFFQIRGGEQMRH